MTRDFAKNQLRRCGGMVAQPSDDVALAERVSTLERCSRSEEHCQRIIDSILHTNQFFPTVSDLVQASEYISGESTPQGCGRCAGANWVVVVRNGYDGAARCDCERGRYLANRDRERKAAA